MGITCNNWILLNKHKEAASEYERKFKQLKNEHVEFAKIKLDKQDISVLKFIHRFKIVTSKQIWTTIFKNEKYPNRYCNKKLKKLYDLGCIDRFFPAVNSGSPLVHVVLSKVGAKILDINKFRKIERLPNNWRHTVLSNDISSYLINKYSLFILKTEVPMEWEEKNGKKKIQADIYVNWDNGSDIGMHVMFEIDTGTESMSELYSKLKNYHKYFNSEALKQANWQPYKDVIIIPKVVFVMDSEERAKKLQLSINKKNSNVVFEVQTFKTFNI